ncbi:hypothetical protein, partial [Sphaerisporangium rhizosphaerae]
MSLTDIVRTIAKNVRQTVTDPRELKEKAKDLPLNVLQTALSGVGQALMLSDRVRTGIKRLISDDDKAAADERGSGVTSPQVVMDEREEREEKPARREPVIFAPRPRVSADHQNGAAAKPSDGAATTASTTAPTTAASAAPAEAAPPAPVAKPAAGTPAPAAAEPAAAEPATEPATAESAVTEPAATTAEPAAATAYIPFASGPRN